MPIISPVQPPLNNPNTPRTKAQQAGPAIMYGADMYQTGGGLLAQGVAGNGVGKVTMPQGPAMPTSQVAPNSFSGSFGFGGAPLGRGDDKGTGYGMSHFGVGSNPGMPQLNSPTTASNPYLGGMANDITNRAMQSLGQNNLNIQGNSVASGGLGGSRQGVAQGIAMGQTADALTGQLAGMYGNAYEGDQNRAMQQYGIDSGSYNTQRGQDVTMRGQDFQNYNQGQDRALNQYQGDQSYYTAQRGQDLAQTGMGAGLVTQGLNTQWLPMQNASDVYAKFAGQGTTTNTQNSGGGWLGALGGAAGVYQMGNAGGWWGK